MTATKLTINFKFKPKPMLQVEQATYVELLMLVLDFKVDYRLKNTQKYFCGMQGMP